jgi:hypothetical protein
MINYTPHCFNQLTSLMKYYLPLNQIVDLYKYDMKGSDYHWYLNQPVYEGAMVWMIVIVIVRIPTLIVIPWLIKKFNIKINKIIKPDNNVEYEETYCVFSYDLHRFMRQLLIVLWVICLIDILYITMFIIQISPLT